MVFLYITVMKSSRALWRLFLPCPLVKESWAPGKIPPISQLHVGFGLGSGSSWGLIIAINFPFCASSLMPGPGLQMLVAPWPVRVGSGARPGGCLGRAFIASLKCL